ncbi:MAG: hypothetical protein ABFC73_06330 [Clostridiaceae bacterium]
MKHQQHVVKKAAILVCISLIFASLCAGCVARSESFNDLDTDGFYANIKPDASANYSKKASFYDGRIYYLSAESGTQGIYSMNADGSDVRLEQATEDIRALAVNGDGLYYAGYIGMSKNDNGLYRSFRLFHQDPSSGAIVDILNQSNCAEDLSALNVWDFAITSDQIIWLRYAEMDWLFGQMRLNMLCMDNSVVVPVRQYENLVEERKLFSVADNDADLSLYRYGSACILLDEVYQITEDTVSLGGDSVPIVFDTETEKTALGYDSVFQDHSHALYYNTSDRWILRMRSDTMLLASQIGLMWYDSKARTFSEPVSFPETEVVISAYDTGGDVLLTTRLFRKNGWFNETVRSIFHIPALKGSCLYRANPDAGTITKLLSLKRDEAFLYVDSQTAATASGQTISLYDITGESPALIRTIELQHTIADSANKVDTAGGWLFLYRFNAITQRDELLDKVFIG